MTETKGHGVCRGDFKGSGQWSNPKIKLYVPKCRLIHHFNPYLKLGPFHLEIHFYWPFRGVFHDFLSDEEMQWMVEISIPRLSAMRASKRKQQCFMAFFLYFLRVCSETSVQRRSRFTAGQYCVDTLACTWKSEIKSVKLTPRKMSMRI